MSEELTPFEDLILLKLFVNEADSTRVIDTALAAHRLQEEVKRLTDVVNERNTEIAKLDASVYRLKAESAASAVPAGMVPLTIEFEPGYPEDVAFGSQMQMDRLKLWLDKYYELRLSVASAVPVAWRIEVDSHDNQYFVDDLDDAMDDLTNSNAVAIPLYEAAPTPPAKGESSKDGAVNERGDDES